MVRNILYHNSLLGYGGDVYCKIFEGSVIMTHLVEMQHGVAKQQKIMICK